MELPPLAFRQEGRHAEGLDTNARRDDARFDWDVALGRRWVLLLFIGALVPLVLGTFGMSVWIWPWTGWGDAPPPAIALSLLPFLLGAGAWALLGLERRRLRGALLLLLAIGALLAPLARALYEGNGGAAGALELLLSNAWQAFALTFGCVLIAAGNRQQKRSLGRGAAPWIAGAGGLAILAAFLTAPLSLLAETAVWKQFWVPLIWVFGLAAFGVLGAFSPIAARLGDGIQAWVERSISRLARLLPMSLPVIVLGTYAWAGFPAFGSFFLLVLKVSLQGYAVLFLMTIGLARLLDDADPDTVWVDASGTEEDAEAMAEVFA